ncbi:MAG TPA: hypothetical protein VM282_12410 [Acidimicrobiales bacterium]|nr:hypothetical protein [Acidimicrobiales bacterium]
MSLWWLINSSCVCSVTIDIKPRVFITLDEGILAELDARTAVANQLLDGIAGNDVAQSETVADIQRIRKQKLVPGAWLVIEIAGDYPTQATALPELDVERRLSFELVNASLLPELGGRAAQAFHNWTIGMVCLAARHSLRSRRVGRGWWYIRPDGLPHYEISFSMNAQGVVSTGLRPEAITDLPQLLSSSEGDPRVGRAIAAYGLSLESDLDPNLEFLAAFTAVELLANVRTNRPAWMPSAKRKGLAKRFARVAVAEPSDCDMFDNLYAARNGLAHEARFTATAGEHARQLFAKYLV